MKQNSSGFKLYVMDGSPSATKKLIAEQVSMTLSSSTNTIDVTTKDNGGFEDFIGGLQSGEVTLEYMVDFDIVSTTDKLGHMEMEGFKATRALKTYKAEVTSPGGKLYSQSFVALITKLDTSAGLEDTIKVSLTLKRAGAPTTTVTSA